MEPSPSVFRILVIVGLGLLNLNAASDLEALQIRQRAGQTEVFLPSEPVPPLGGSQFRLTVESSPDLSLWGSPAELLPAEDASAPLKLLVGGDGAGFYRLRAELEDVGSSADGAELFGYNRIFAAEQRRIGYPTVDEFQSAQTPTHDFLARVSFDPTTARYWTEFNTDPALFNASLPTDSLDRRLHDFRLNAEEMVRFQTNGFVVSERLGSPTFADRYYAVFADDLPVFISADSVLHAWHWTYQAMLGELEETQLTQALESLLAAMSGQVAFLGDAVVDGPLKDSVRDADYFLAVGRSLLKGIPVTSALGQNPRVAETLAAVAAGQYQPDFVFWGDPRPMDFSQFTVRGHYTRTPELGRYFQAFLWTTIADLRIAGGGGSPRELATALILHELLTRSGASESWETVDQLVRLFVGRTQSLGFRELGPLRTAAGLSLEAAGAPGRLEAFQTELLRGDHGVQTYATAAYPSPFGTAQTQLPRAFAVNGKRFIADGWATAQVTFDRIRWNSELPDGQTFFGKVVRRLPTGLDVAFGVLGNAQVTPEIADLIRGGFDPARDGLPYHHNLSAVKATIDLQAPSAWEDSIYSRWLFALRMLSAPTTDPRYPESMRTRAWAHKTLNTQLASWTQLRHDTVLYAAQPYTGIIVCEYPAGYVEPRVEFWESMRILAQSTADALDRFPVQGRLPTVTSTGEIIEVDLTERKNARVAHCRNFATQMATLREMSRKELAREPFTDAEVLFIRSTMNSQDHGYFGKTYDGWYPLLFYEDYGQDREGEDYSASDRPDALVTDVHTAPPDVRYEGGVLHEAVGNVDLMLIAVDSGADRMVYAGPTLSHYEFTVGPGVTRLTDAEWKNRLESAKPPRPFWTQDYLVPK